MSYDYIVPGERDIYTEDFSTRLKPGEEIDEVAWTKADPNAAIRISRPSTDGVEAKVLVEGGVLGEVYELDAEVETNMGRVLVKRKTVECIATRMG